MKKIILQTKLKRILARLFDFFISLILSIFVFTLLLPKTFNKELYDSNTKKIKEYYEISNLFIKTENGNFYSKVNFNSILTIKDLIDLDVKIENTNKKIHIIESLKDFYCLNLEKVTKETNYSVIDFNNKILKVNNEISNIKSISYENNKIDIELINNKEEKKTINYVINVFKNAINFFENNSFIKEYNKSNKDMMKKQLLYLLYYFIAFSFILDFLLPLFSKNNQSLGMRIFKSILLDKDGYKLKKIYLFPRWLGYILIEILLSIFTMGATILISYTMFLFNKKHRCIHDYFGNSVVVNKEDTFYFDSREEEEYIKNNVKRYNFNEYK